MDKFEILDKKWLKITQCEKKTCFMKLEDINFLRLKYDSKKYKDKLHIITISCPSGEFDLIYNPDDNNSCGKDFEKIKSILGIPN